MLDGQQLLAHGSTVQPGQFRRDAPGRGDRVLVRGASACGTSHMSAQRAASGRPAAEQHAFAVADHDADLADLRDHAFAAFFGGMSS